MLEGLSQLIELQKLDDQLATLEEEQRALPERRAALATERAAAEERLGTVREALREAELGQRKAERELQDREAELSRLEGQQVKVSSNAAYTALLREMENARTAISGCETRILESMEVVSVQAAALAAAESATKAACERADAGEHALAARERELAGRISELRERRTGLRAGIAREVAELYERVASRRRPAVVVVTGAICAGCRVDIPPQKIIEIRRGENIVSCGHCQRILIPAHG